MLLQQLAVNEKTMFETYSLLSTAVLAKQRISPAGEWLLDNFYLIEEQIRLARRHLPKGFSRELPHLSQSARAGYPRVYDIALEVIAHVDGRVDKENISAFIHAYQQVSPLKLGEFWAVPIMLRLALIENLSRISSHVVQGMKDREKANQWADQLLSYAEHDASNLILVAADMARSNPPMSNAFVAELARLLRGQGSAVEIPLTWIEQHLVDRGQNTQQLIQLESQQQAANQVAVGASIGSLRFLSSMDWRDFVEATSLVEQELRRDPAGIYPSMDFTTRDHYRHVIEDVAKRSKRSEGDVARQAIDLARKAGGSPGSKPSHVGYYLIDRGLTLLDPDGQKLFGLPAAWHLRKHLPRILYFIGIGSLTTGMTAALALLFGRNFSGWLTFLAFVGLLLLSSSQVALAMVNWLATLLLPPHRLPRLDFSKGIPDEFRSLVVIPTMLVNRENIDSLLDALEVRYLANRDNNLHFALLTDLIDASTATLPGDELLLAWAIAGIEGLNAKYPMATDALFCLFHRNREWNEQEQSWMGFERKRGKLEALNSYLRSDRSHNSFSLTIGSLPPIKYVITLDTDTQLPRDAARKLVGTMAHPLNHPHFDSARGRVTEGYSILQPQIATSLPSSRRSLFVILYGGDAGIDPYTRVVSDVYQDLFFEGSFVGKGIYDVDAFTQALAGALPKNLILSHDLIEGCYARSGLVNDVQLFEDFPCHHGDDVQRRSRWMRGDWQISAWLLARTPTLAGTREKNSISSLSKWKIFDNLRRSLVPIATFLLIMIAWHAMESLATSHLLIATVMAMIFLPQLLTSLAEATRKPPEIPLRTHLLAALSTMVRHLCQATLAVVFLPFEAFLSLTAILRSLTRMLVTHRRLLAWKSASDPRHLARAGVWQFYRHMAAGPTIALIVLFELYLSPEKNLGLGFSLVGLWFFSPIAAFWLSRPTARENHRLTEAQTDFLQRIARKTWHFFEVFVGPEDHWLPPDNFQEYPRSVIAHRTSPTNMGLSLLANLAAYDFGYIPAFSLLDRCAHSFKTMMGMERFRGHFYNWYDTQSLKPLLPLYVSSVDSGNLAGLLLTLNQGLRELPEQKIIRSSLLQGLRDTLLVLRSYTQSPTLDKMSILLMTEPQSLSEWWNLQLSLAKAISLFDASGNANARLWGLKLEEQWISGIEQSLLAGAPWVFLSAPPEEVRNDGNCSELLNYLAHLVTVPTLLESRRHAEVLIDLCGDYWQASEREHPWIIDLHKMAKTLTLGIADRLQLIDTLVTQSTQLANFEYEFLYDRSQHLLSIGYNVSEHRRDNSFYDLLASEARLGSFVAIAQGYLPQEHWFALGRLLTTWNRQATLLSWSGSMFEYLMPLLVMPTYKDTLLDQTYHTAVQRQISYGREHGVPWGISESGFNTTDVNLNYQYRAFGVPGLGFKRGLAEDLVIAPYASVMALMVNPARACENMQRMQREGFEGAYGFYEAIDYTPSRLPSGQTQVIVRSFMAHHEGMSFLSLAYHLHDRLMQKRFSDYPLFKATELLLHERVPKAARHYPHAPEVRGAQRVIAADSAVMQVIDTPHTPRPEVHLLSNGRYTVMITNAGGGYSRWKDLAVTRWREDPTTDNWGTFCYIRDLKSGEIWSATHQPSLKASAHYEAIFPQARAEFRRRDHGLELHTEITVSPEDDIELRRFSMTNLSSHRRVIEFTSYAEVVLVPAAVDEAHPAFSNLFVQTEILPEKKAILCTRRPRSDKEKTPTLLHLMTVHGAVEGDASYETDRSRFIGRGGSVHDPLMLRANQRGVPLSGQEGSVLDPIVAIRHCIVIEPEQTVRIYIVTGIGETRGDALSLMEKYHDRHVADRVFELAWTHCQVVLRQLNISEVEAQLYTRLASSILYTNPLRRASPSILTKNRRGQSGLWGYGISGDLPIVLLRISNLAKTEILQQLIQAHRYWHTLGLVVDLVIWNEDDSGYRQDLNDRIMELIAAGSHFQKAEKQGEGRIFVCRSEQMSEEDKILLQTVARAVWSDANGSLADQMGRRGRVSMTMAPLLPAAGAVREPPQADADLPPRSRLLFDNGSGGFSADGREYLIYTTAEQLTPAPWSNVIANRFFGTVVSESGSAYTWCENAHEFRLTPWNNDALTDASGEAFYLRDEESTVFWSPTPLPARAEATYLTRHGFGYSNFTVTTQGIHSELTTFVAIDAPVKMALITVRNDSDRNRRLSVTGYCEWVLGKQRAKSLMHVSSELDVSSGALFVRNPYHGEFGGRLAFYALSEKLRTTTSDRSEFIGRNGHLSHPAAMGRQGLSGRSGAALDACSAMQAIIDLAPGEERQLVFLLGVARDVGDARTLIQRFGEPAAAKAALVSVRQYWEHCLGAVQVQTPDPAVNILANGWLVYQTLACRVWARSGYYQSGGAFGFRDQLQDTMALLHCEPALLREHILRCAAHQYREGDVQHWWHPPSGLGVRTHFSDDYLWLPLATSRYVSALGDTGILTERVHFIEGRQVKLDEEAYSDLPARSDESATLYEHCVRALRYGMKYGKNGLPLMGCGDWNDGMNLVGEHGKGESVWLAFFLIDVLQRFAPIARLFGDEDFAAICLAQAANIKGSIEENAWDGAWYRRAYFDNGQALGSQLNVECQIDSIPQSWSVLSGAGDAARSRSAMEAVDRRLVDRKHGLIKLFDPPFDRSDLNPGYVKGYVPGVRENGGQYTHAAIWMAMAFAKMGDQKRAWELLKMINPLHHGDTAEKIAVYKVEPYVMAADVYAVSPHSGRGGWTWYTGSSGWMYRLIVESLLGLRLEVDRLHFAPCFPSDWPEFSIRYRFRETFYDITVRAVIDGDERISVNGVQQEETGLLLLDDRESHQVLVEVQRLAPT